MAKPAPKTKTHKIALVGTGTLLGREIQDVLQAQKTGALITPYASSGAGNFGEQEGEAVYLEALEARSLKDHQAVILAGSEEGASKTYDLVKAAGGHPPIIDCTSYLDAQPEARIVAPLLAHAEAGRNWLFIVAHPAASALALVLLWLGRRKPIQQAIAHIFEPASERGKRGLSELHQQTTSLFSFKPLDKDIFDAQLSFNLLSQYGEEAPSKLSTIEQRIERHTATILSRDPLPNPIPMPSLRLLQAPVFHGYSISLWVSFAAEIDAVELGESLASAQIEIRTAQQEAPHAVGAAGQSGLIAGDIRVDRNNPRAAWFWIVGDNLRMTADAAVGMLTSLEPKQQ